MVISKGGEGRREGEEEGEDSCWLHAWQNQPEWDSIQFPPPHFAKNRREQEGGRDRLFAKQRSSEKSAVVARPSIGREEGRKVPF